MTRLFRYALSWCKNHPARAGSLTGLFQQACSMGVAVFLIPVVTSFLTSAEAGLWFSFQGLISMVAMIDLGFGFAISRQAAFTLGSGHDGNASGDFIELASGACGIHQLFSLTRKLYIMLAVGSAVLAVITYEIILRFGHLIPDGTQGTRSGWYGIAIASVFLIFTGGYSSFLNGLGAVYQTRLAAGIYQIFAGFGAGIAAWMGGGLPWMAASFAICAAFYLVVISTLLRKSIPPAGQETIPSPTKGSFRRLANAALPIGGINIFSSLVYTVQAPLLGTLLGPQAVVPFYLAQKIGLAFSMLSMQLALPQLPFFTMALGKKNWAEASNRLNSTVKKTGAIVLISSLAYFLVSPWMALVLLRKSEYVNSSVLSVMALDFCILGLAGVAGQFVLASGKNPFMISTILTGITSVSLVAALTPHLGIIALPISTLTAGLIFNSRKCFVEYRKLKSTTANHLSNP